MVSTEKTEDKMIQQFDAPPHWKQKSQIRGEMIEAWLNGSSSGDDMYFFIKLAQKTAQISDTPIIDAEPSEKP